MPVKKREAMRQAIDNAAALLEAMDLEIVRRVLRRGGRRCERRASLDGSAIQTGAMDSRA